MPTDSSRSSAWWDLAFQMPSSRLRSGLRWARQFESPWAYTWWGASFPLYPEWLRQSLPHQWQLEGPPAQAYKWSVRITQNRGSYLQPRNMRHHLFMSDLFADDFRPYKCNKCGHAYYRKHIGVRHQSKCHEGSLGKRSKNRHNKSDSFELPISFAITNKVRNKIFI